MQKQSITASISGMPRNGEVSRTTEVSALRTLSPQEEKIIDAVEMAIKEIGKQRDGAEVLKIVEMVEFSKQYTLDGAAMKLYMHRNTASSRLGRFIDAVGRYMEF